MSIVNLVSGGLDSTLVGVLAQDEGIEVHPLFIDYGQRASEREWQACKAVHNRFGMPRPTRMNISGFGKVIRSGLTSAHKHVRNDAFTPGRNLLLLTLGAAFSLQVGASVVAIGLLSERFSLFPDQTGNFVEQAEKAIVSALGRPIKIVMPLSDFSKADIIRLAKEKGINNTYSCHTGMKAPCGKCISCLEIPGS